jgi:YD repeat-containing protein
VTGTDWRSIARRAAFVAAIVAGLIAPAVFPQPTALAAPASPSPRPSVGPEDCDPAKGPPLNARFQGIGRVALFNGTYSFDAIDLGGADSIAATFSRGYISGDTRSNNLGLGWNSNYGVRLRSYTSKDLVFTDPTGFTSKFLDGYSRPTIDVMQYMTLTPPPPDWVVSDGITTWTLDGVSGNLVRVETKGGAFLDVHYDGDRPIDSIGPDGTGLVFEQDAKGRFVQVTDRQDERQWVRFSYDADGRLSQVDRPWGTTERYAYVGQTQQLQTISNGADEPLFRVDYDEQGRAIKERDAQGLLDGQGVEYVYKTLLDGSVKTTVTYPESRLDPSWRPIQTAVHDSQGNLRELVLQPTRTEGFLGKYDYNASNRRVVLRDACDLAPAADILQAAPPPSLLDGLLRQFEQFVRQLLAAF